MGVYVPRITMAEIHVWLLAFLYMNESRKYVFFSFLADGTFRTVAIPVFTAFFVSMMTFLLLFTVVFHYYAPLKSNVFVL